MSGISFSDIPGQSALFRTYLSDPLALKQFYPNVVEFPQDIKDYIHTVLQNYDTDRNRLADALAATNRVSGAGASTLENIELLRDAETIAIVTGQQAGLFTGPVYTIYKALFVIKMAQDLMSDGLKAVPVFWNRPEDPISTRYHAAKFENSASELLPLGF